MAGIDYSIGGPAMCIHPYQETWDYQKCRFTFVTGTKCRAKSYTEDSVIFSGHLPIQKYNYDVERFMHNANIFISQMLSNNVTEVKLEGYAYGAKGRGLFNIAEATGILKRYIVSNNFNLSVDTPPAIKKYATDKGNAPKQLMVETYEKETGIDLVALFEINGVGSPVDDIVDSYYICKLLHNNLYK